EQHDGVGTARIELATDRGEYGQHSFEIQEYRTPEFEVTASGADGVYALGEDATVDVTAAYYAGGGLAMAPVQWSVTATPASFVPPGRDDWSFGPWSPWWKTWWEPTPYVEPVTLDGVTDAAGAHHLGIHFAALHPARPMSVSAEATVVDVNRQAWTATKSFLVHPAALYVGLKAAKPYVEAKKPVEVDTLVVDRAGKQAAAEVRVALYRLVWKKVAGEWKEVREPAGETTVKGGAGKATFTPEVGGEHAVVATVKDAAGRPNETEIRVWVAGEQLVPDRGVGRESLTLVPEKKSWSVGETAGVLVQAPFWPAEGLLTVRAGGAILETRPFAVTEAATPLTFAITEAHVPDVHVAVEIVGARPRTDDAGRPLPDVPKRVAFAGGSLALDVSRQTRALTVKVAPVEARLQPGGKTEIALTVTGPDGRPAAGAELAVVAVDEAVLALTGYALPDPLTVFYGARGDGVMTEHLREWVALASPETVPGLSGGLGASGYGAGGGGIGYGGAVGRGGVAADAVRMEMAPSPPTEAPAASEKVEAKRQARNGEAEQTGAPAIQLRSDFSALALWAPSVVTDANGKATVPLALPDSLTRYRVMAVAVTKDRFGSGTADVTARLPLMVRPSAPRFLNFGDCAELPVVLQDETEAPLTV
ncbi:MAG: alpha-2-macroglobulin family protein, partial [Myxococcota bacterium]